MKKYIRNTRRKRDATFPPSAYPSPAVFSRRYFLLFLFHFFFFFFFLSFALSAGRRRIFFIRLNTNNTKTTRARAHNNFYLSSLLIRHYPSKPLPSGPTFHSHKTSKTLFRDYLDATLTKRSCSRPTNVY